MGSHREGSEHQGRLMAKPPPAQGMALGASGRSLANRVADELLHHIISGAFAPGDPLPAERDLAQKLEVGRGSLREALRALSFLGVIEIQHGGRARIAPADLETLLRPLGLFLRLRNEGMHTLLEARTVFETAAARIAATRIDARALARLGKLLERKKAAAVGGKVSRSIDLDAEFHQVVVEATGNAFLIEIGRNLYELGRAGRAQTSQSAQVTNDFLQDHEDIVEALRRADAQAAGRAMERHMAHIRRHLKDMETASADASAHPEED